MTKRNLGTAVLAAALVLIASCGGDAPNRPPSDDEPDLRTVEDDDAAMDAAINKARATVDTFIAALTAPKDSQAGFSVKMAIKEGDYTEHLWIDSPGFKDGVFSGTIARVSRRLTMTKPGDPITSKKNEISDWMFVEDKKLVGGYTVRELRSRMSPEERAEFDKSIPFKIE